MELRVYTSINPTENKKKITEKMQETFPGCKFNITGKIIECKTSDTAVLEKLKQKIEEKRIKHTIQYLIVKNQTQSGTKVELNKQTFMLGKINFVEEQYPLGNVVIESDKPTEFLKVLTGL
jgi:predicted RNA binding protein with dsRBD fold (UPF0201 family)